MIRNPSTKRALVILSAAGVIVLLTASLALRMSAWASAPTIPEDPAVQDLDPPDASVPEPRSVSLAEIPTPFRWARSWNQDAPLVFHVDLDLLAPLGDGEGNAAVWFRQFARDGARREKDSRPGYSSRIVKTSIGGRTYRVLPGDDPLLLEAEPWVDQATCRFYPEVWKVTGMDTRIPDLRLMLDLARSWVARGKLSGDPVAAREDFRRAIRLGRLLRQDDVTIIQDLVAVSCIGMGAEALFELAREEGDPAMMVATALVVSNDDAIRLMTAKRVSSFEPTYKVRADGSTEMSLTLTDDELESIIGRVRRASERRIRMEGLIALQAAKHLGSHSQRETAQEALEEFSSDPDDLLAGLARQFRDVTLTRAELRQFVEGLH
jgi:hypothetical protein